MKTREWIYSRPLFVSVPAIQMAASAVSICILLEKTKSNDTWGFGFASPAIEQWLSLYLSRHRLLNYLGLIHNSLGNYGRVVKDFLKTKDSLTINPKELKTDKITEPDVYNNTYISCPLEKSFSSALETIAQYYLNQLNSAHMGKELEVFTQDENKGIEITPELIFVIFVGLPCWALYRTAPSTLLRSARMGSVDEIEMLARLDSSIIFDKKISEHIHQLRTRDHNEYRRIINALMLPPKPQVNSQRIKMILSGLISYSTERVGHRLTEPEIRDLFDAIAYDLSKGETNIDTDLPESPEAFSQAILRERKIWMKIYPDKK